MKENPEDQLETNSPENEAPELHATPPRIEAPIANTRDPDQESSPLEPEQANHSKTGEIVQAPPVIYAVSSPQPARKIIPAPPVAAELEGIAANGGAVGAVVLGVWSILGSTLTSWSLINAVLGLAMGLWGLSSKRPRTAWIGIVLSVLGAFLSLAVVSEWVTGFWQTNDNSLMP
jgi:hypothetical protein